MNEHTIFNNRLQPQMIGLGTSATNSSAVELHYYYGGTDNNRNVLHHTSVVGGVARQQVYEYDQLNRLKKASEVNQATGALHWQQAFTYDRFGNRNFDVANTTPAMLGSNLSVNQANNRYAANQGVSYDAAGNVTSGVGGHSFAYDGENRQTSYDNGAATYSYDGDGRRVKKVTGIVTTIFVYDAGGQLVAEYSTSTPEGSGGTSYLTSDLLGTPRVITDSNGAVKARHDYLPFGEEIAVNVGGRTTAQKYVYGVGDDGVRQKFTKKERDVETGLDYFGARYYSSTQGRFTSVDPLDPVLGKQGANHSEEAEVEFRRYLGQPQNWNRYVYALNNPLKYIDPSGEAPTITVRMNIIWERSTAENGNQGFANEEAARRAAQKYIDYLRKAYGSLDIAFEISFTEGTAYRPNDSDNANIDLSKKVEGALNVFLTSRHPKAMGAAFARENGDIFLNVRANGESRLAHEVAHPLGLSTWPSGHNYTYLGSEWDIDTSLPNMYQGSIKEGRDWFDDYRKIPPKDSIVVIRGGAQFRRTYYSPTTYYILRVGAQRFTGKR